MVISTRRCTTSKNPINAVIAYLGSTKPLDVLEHACGTPLITEAFVLHTYPFEGWDYSFRF